MLFVLVLWVSVSTLWFGQILEVMLKERKEGTMNGIKWLCGGYNCHFI